MAYLTVQEFKEFKGIKSSEDDELLQSITTAAQLYIEDRQFGTGRKYEASADTTRYFNAVDDIGYDTWDERHTLYLDEDLASITSITNGDGVVVATNEYTTIPKNRTPYDRIRLLRSGGKYWTYDQNPENAITIVGKWAYQVTVTDDVKQIMRRFVDHLYEQRKNPQVGAQPVFTSSGVILMPQQVPADVREWITMKRRMPLR